MKALITFIFLVFSISSMAQFGFQAGLQYSNLRDDGLLENNGSIFTYQLGITYRYQPFENIEKLDFQHELLLEEKGYEQVFDKTYDFRFRYITFSILANYSIVESIALQGGVYMGGLLDTNIREGQKTYNEFDAGLLFGLSFLDDKTATIYTRVSYGLTPILDYPRIDNLGNFNGEISALKHVNLILGTKIFIGR